MKKIANTNIKVISKIREYESCDTVDIVYDILDHNRAESIKNGTVISRQKGGRRLIDRNRNAIAHEVVDYSEFKVTKLEQGQTVDNSKKEKQLEDAALSLLADLGIDWSDDEEIDEPEQEEIEETQTVENEEPQTVENEPAELDSLIAEVTGQKMEPQTVKKARTFADIVNHPYVDSIDDAREYQEGIWIYLRRPYYNVQLQLTMIHEYTVKDCCDILNNMVRPGTDEELNAACN